MQVLGRDGLIVSSSCSYHLRRMTCSRDRTRRRNLNRHVELLETGGQAPDHPIHPAIPETRYLKLFSAVSFASKLSACSSIRSRPPTRSRSPSDLHLGGWTLGPIDVHWYGIMYLLGFIAGVVLARMRAANRARPGSRSTSRT